MHAADRRCRRNALLFHQDPEGLRFRESRLLHCPSPCVADSTKIWRKLWSRGFGHPKHLDPHMTSPSRHKRPYLSITSRPWALSQRNRQMCGAERTVAKYRILPLLRRMESAFRLSSVSARMEWRAVSHTGRSGRGRQSSGTRPAKRCVKSRASLLRLACSVIKKAQACIHACA